jgi:hypothetical protein
LPAKCKLVKGQSPRQSVPVKGGYSQLDWLVEASAQGASHLELTVVLTPDGLEERVSFDIEAGNLID